MIRAVTDTSVLIRYLIKASPPIRGLTEVRWLGDEVQMVTAPDLIEELEGVLRRDYIQALIRPQEGQTLLDAIHQKAEILPPLGTIPPTLAIRKTTSSSLVPWPVVPGTLSR